MKWGNEKKYVTEKKKIQNIKHTHTHTQTGQNLPIVPGESAIASNSFSIMKPLHIVDDCSGDRTIENCCSTRVYYLNLWMNVYGDV